MSTTTISVRTSADEARIEEVRRREAEARQAARRAAQRAAEIEAEKRREAKEREAARRRLNAANRVIAEQEEKFQREVSRLDEAMRRLPDLSLKVPYPPSMGRSDASDPAGVEEYGARFAETVAEFGRQIDKAIHEAEILLSRRIAKAAAWRTASDLEQQTALRRQGCQDVASRLREAVGFEQTPVRPDAEAELESIEAYVAEMRRALEAVDRQYASLAAREDSRKRAAALAGMQVLTRNASEVHDQHETERKAAIQANLRGVVEVALEAARMHKDDLSHAVRLLVEDAIAHSHTQDRSEQVARWIAREKQHQDGVRRALELMQNAPDLVHEDPSLSQRWTSLLDQLQHVASGLGQFTPNLDREYEQIRADARRSMRMAYTKADWLQAMSDEGFEILEREDGQGLVVVDLDHPEVWLEATELEPEEGGFGAVLELKTDHDSKPEIEAKITASICNRLGKVAGASAPKVQAQAEVIERKSRITRAQRPERARKAAAQNL